MAKERMTASGNSDPSQLSQTEQAKRLLEIVRTLATELHPQSALPEVGLSTLLDRELGFDSLSRVELLLRVERNFNVSLPPTVIAEAERPADLLRVLLAAAPGGDTVTLQQRSVAPQESQETPLHLVTLPEVLDWHLSIHPQRIHVQLYGNDTTPRAISYAELHREASSIAGGLQALGVSSGDRVALMLPTGPDYLYCFFGALLVGAIPVPIYPPVRLSQLEEHLRRHAEILRNAAVTLLITVAEAKTLSRLLQAQVATMQWVITPSELSAPGSHFLQPRVQPTDTAFLQYTSGSTGAPKGVVLSHANLLANITAMGTSIQASARDTFVSWLPLYHDMGLIGAWLGSLFYAMPLVLLSPLAFLARPQRWLQAIHTHRATLSAAPNFAYELCLNKIREEDSANLDLGSWRMAFNGAEPVSARTLTRFSQRFASCGFRPESMMPVYGLAEAAVGLAFPPCNREPLIDRVERAALFNRGRAVIAAADAEDPLELVACGQPLPGYQIRIVDPSGRELPERREGAIQFNGPSATAGYYANPQATQALYSGAWLNTGDRGYIAAGEIYLTSRSKELIIRGGRNIYPYEAEEAVGAIAGIRRGCVAMFGSNDPQSATEKLVLVAESKTQEPARREQLRKEVLARVTDLLGMPPDDVVICPPHAVLKTSSGKIRRNEMRLRYEQGDLHAPPAAPWRQLLRLTLGSLRPGWQRLRRRLLDTGYALYAHLIFWLLAPPFWLLVVLLPGSALRWRMMRFGARSLLTLTGIPLHTEGVERLPQSRSCVLVANHSSYLDGVVLAAALPLKFAFIAKSELQQNLLSRLFLQRIGAQFVERFDHQRGIADARDVESTLSEERALLYFPEGTLRRAPGLLPFHMGAFSAAAAAGAPVVPITIRGTRSILRDTSWFPHHGEVNVHISEPIFAVDTDWSSAIELRNRARAAMLAQLDEPDLSREKHPLPN